MSQKLIEKKILYSKLLLDKESAILSIEKALTEIKNESFHALPHQLNPSLENITYACKLLYQIGYANSLVIVEEG